MKIYLKLKNKINYQKNIGINCTLNFQPMKIKNIKMMKTRNFLIRLNLTMKQNNKEETEFK